MTQGYDDLVKDALARVREILPWELSRLLATRNDFLLLDVREPAEFSTMHIPGSINVPRGILEQSCEWNYDETVPELANGRDQPVMVICRSGKRSVLAADVMLRMGFTNAVSLKLGVQGWNDSELPLQDINGKRMNPDQADVLLASHLRAEQRDPKSA